MVALEALSQRLRRSRALKISARFGMVARGVLYLLLAYLAAALAAGWGLHDRQVNGNGALRAVAATPLGLIALTGAALGFAAFGLVRLAGAYGDHAIGRARRLTTAGQAIFYLAMAVVTTSFILGRRSTGSEQQQDSTTARVLSEPGGRIALALVGVVALAVCAWQVWIGLRGGFTDSLRTRDMGRRTHRVTRWVGRVGIVARAAAVAPLAVLLVVAALSAKPGDAKGLDELLMTLNNSAGGRVVVWLVAAGFLVFAVYSFLESRYRDVHAGD
jgi:hypothetical protein